ncbi:hypothetical protein ABZP36_034087 [Zizania latifolia]
MVDLALLGSRTIVATKSRRRRAGAWGLGPGAWGRRGGGVAVGGETQTLTLGALGASGSAADYGEVTHLLPSAVSSAFRLLRFCRGLMPPISLILHCKLVLKKRLFRESDEAITDPMFVQLSYVQLQHDYISGNYPVGRDDAAQLSALQILVEIGFVDNPESCVEWIPLLERFLPRQVAITRAKRDWELDIVSRYQLMEHLSKDDARQQFLRISRALPYGNLVFFGVRKIDDPIGLLPGSIILGINKRGA